MPVHKEQRLSSYISGKGITVYETEQYNAFTREWYIVGDSSTNLELITVMIDHHNIILQVYHAKVTI